MSHELAWRQAPDAPHLFDNGSDLRVGAEYRGFHEEWEVSGGQHVRRIAQRANGRRYRIVGKDEPHSWTFSDYDNIHRFAKDDPNAIRLQDIG
ncbi:MAG: hypothetical protein ACHREM_14075 [Polyangiales bacterium]